jgi:hypothetical protein
VTRCNKCGYLIEDGKVLSYANAGHMRDHWTPCHSAWHATCYRQVDARFRVQRADEDEEEDEDTPFVEDNKSDIRFEDARDGDHFMCPFQCDLCHFRNIQKRDPLSGTTDTLLEACIRRANLDALWAREPRSVSGNLRERRRALKGALRLGIEDPHPFPRGSFPVKDTMGMAMACTILERSMDLLYY